MIHEILPDSYDPAFIDKKAGIKDMVLAYRKNSVLALIKNKEIRLPDFFVLKESLLKDEMKDVLENAYYLFSISGRSYFLAEFDLKGIPEFPDAEELFKEYEAAGSPKENEAPFFFLMNINKFRELITVKNKYEEISEEEGRVLDPYKANKNGRITKIFAASTGLHMTWWKRSRSFCGFCGAKAVPSHTERAMICPSCNNIEYPKISPAVIVAIIKRGKDPKEGIPSPEDMLLLVRNNYGSYRKLALVAGFVEIGESFEQAVHREVFEETGLKVKNLRYYKNQPWGLSFAQMIGFVAELDGDDQIILQKSELSEGAWYKRDEIPDYPFMLSVGNEMIHQFKAGRLL